MQIKAYTQKMVGGVREARIDFPLSELTPLVDHVSWSDSGINLAPIPNRPNVLILHRKYLNEEHVIVTLEKAIKLDWLLIMDLDDDPSIFPDFVNSNFFGIKFVHAVTVSTNALAKSIRQINPYTFVLKNHISSIKYQFLPEFQSDGNDINIRITIAALNRSGEFQKLIPILNNHLLEDNNLYINVVGDDFLFDQLLTKNKKKYPLLDYNSYLSLLSSSELALLPLDNNTFNSCKSDLKLIECLSSGCVPICSPTVYGELENIKEIAWVASDTEDWSNAIYEAKNFIKRKIKRQAGFDYVVNERMHRLHARDRVELYQTLYKLYPTLELSRMNRIHS